MRTLRLFATVAMLTVSSFGDVRLKESHETPGSQGFRLKNIPRPSRSDAATKGRFTIIDGTPDANGAGVRALNDGRLPTNEDQPDWNFFFNANSKGGRLLLDLGETIAIQAINTYSWHRDVRAGQVYTVYGSDSVVAAGTAPKCGTDPQGAGWTKIHRVTVGVENDPPGGRIWGEHFRNR